MQKKHVCAAVDNCLNHVFVVRVCCNMHERFRDGGMGHAWLMGQANKADLDICE